MRSFRIDIDKILKHIIGIGIGIEIEIKKILINEHEYPEIQLVQNRLQT